MATLHQPGHDRGLGRYATRLHEAISGLPEFDFVEYRGRRSRRPHRFSEWSRIPHRAGFVARSCGWYHATTPYNLDPLHLTRSAVTVLDLIPLDLNQYTQTGFKTGLVHRWAAHCGTVVTCSEYSAERIVDRLGTPAENVFIAPLPVTYGAGSTEGCSLGCAQRMRGLSTYVAAAIDIRTPDPRKRVAWILGAAQRLADKKVPVVAYGGGTEQLQSPNVIGLGRICDAHMRELLAGAACFLYASAYEGQGLPPQEALLEGTPVVAFRNTSLPEALGPGALWVSERESPWSTYAEAAPSDAQASDLADGAISLLEDPTTRHALATEGAEHVRQFTTDRFRDTMLRVYDALTSAANAG
jgi:glycosyltransferase involved in cell wall biosynthesis